jgi:hypothetical protein
MSGPLSVSMGIILSQCPNLVFSFVCLKRPTLISNNATVLHEFDNPQGGAVKERIMRQGVDPKVLCK